MKKRALIVFLLCAFTVNAGWIGLTEKNHICGPKLTAASLQDKVVLIDVWGSWCHPCRESMPYTEELAKKFRQRPFVVIASHSFGVFDKERVLAFVKEKGFTFSFYKDVTWDGNTGYDQGVPFYYVVDKKGTVVYHGHDRSPIEKVVEKALGKGSGDLFLDVETLVEYKSLKGKLRSGKSIEPVLNRLNADIAMANRNLSSKTFASRKGEAVKIAAAIEEYKKDLIETIQNEIRDGDKSAKEHIELLIATWPSLKTEWKPRLESLTK